MRNEFKRILRCEANEEWRKGKDKNSKKKDHLEARHKPRKENGMVEDIPVVKIWRELRYLLMKLN